MLNAAKIFILMGIFLSCNMKDKKEVDVKKESGIASFEVWKDALSVDQKKDLAEICEVLKDKDHWIRNSTFGGIDYKFRLTVKPCGESVKALGIISAKLFPPLINERPEFEKTKYREFDSSILTHQSPELVSLCARSFDQLPEEEINSNYKVGESIVKIEILSNSMFKFSIYNEVFKKLILSETLEVRLKRERDLRKSGFAIYRQRAWKCQKGGEGNSLQLIL